MHQFYVSTCYPKETLTPTQSCISLCFNMWLCRNIFVFWHFDMTHYSQRNFEIHYLASVLFSHVTQKSLTWLTTHIYTKQRVFSPFVMILSHAYTFSIRHKTLFAPRANNSYNFFVYSVNFHTNMQIFKKILLCGNKTFIKCKLTFFTYWLISVFSLCLYFLIWHYAGKITTQKFWEFRSRTNILIE